MLETIKLGTQAFLFLAITLIIDIAVLLGTLSGGLTVLACTLAAIIILLIWLTGFSCRHDRQRLSEVFGGSVWVLLVLVGAFVFLQGGLLLLLLIEALQARVTNPRALLGLGIAALVAFSSAVAIWASIGTIAHKLTTRALGSVVTAETQPALWQFVQAIAEKIGAVPPNQIIVGLDPTFYATAADIELIGPKRATGDAQTSANPIEIKSHSISGETMYLSLPLMRLLSKDELAAVIGHELGHFKGLDTAYTLEFVPVYRGVVHAIDATSSMSDQSLSGRLITLPASTILKFYLSEFTNAEREIGRERELEADKSGVLASSPNALVGALVKVAAFTPIWPQLCNHAVTVVKDGKMYTNLSTAFAQHADQVRSTVEPAKLAEMILASRQTHPTDTHPLFETRARAIGVDTFDFEKLTKSDQEPSSVLVADAEGVEQSLSFVLQRFFAAREETKSMGEAISRREDPDD